MAIEKFKKQSYEEFPIDAGFSANFGTLTTIASQVVTAEDKDGNDVSTTIIDQGSIINDGAAIVSLTVRAGSESASPYKITVRIIDSDGYKWELDIKMEVKEI